MDPDIVNSPTWGPQLKNALKSLPTFSIVTDTNNLFNPTTGIYVNPRGDERAWERPASLELINPDGSKGFQIDMGLRVRGGFSRDPSNPKHAFRFFFRQEYGDSKLKYPMFASQNGVDSFDGFDLRTFPRGERDRFMRSVTQGTRLMPAFRDKIAPDDLSALWQFVSGR